MQCTLVIKDFLLINIKDSFVINPSGVRCTILNMGMYCTVNMGRVFSDCGTVEPRYNEVLGTMKIALLYLVSHYIRVIKQKYKELGPAKLPCYKRVLLYLTSL